MPKKIDETKHALPSAGFSITLKVKIANIPGSFLGLIQYIADIGGSLTEVKLLYSDFNYLVREITINCKSEEQSEAILSGINQIPRVELLDWMDDTFHIHQGGKLEIRSLIDLRTSDQLARAYTPGVARICTAIHDNVEQAYDYTMKGNSIAVVSDGSAVLGLGNIGPQAALPVMEGKAVLFKHFADLDAFPICLDTQDEDKIIDCIKNLAPVFGGINLEDIAAPRCFEIENRLREEIDIPVFHDDQHGTAAVVLAALLNALKIVGKELSNIKIVVNGFGAGGVACTRMLLSAGVKNIVPCDRAGIVYRGRKERMNPVKEELLEKTNPENEQGTVGDALKGADVFIGVSKPGVITKAMVQSMASDAIVFALANPIPEIMPDEIKDVARVIATGRSDYANQVNNVLCFPGIFRGALDARATDITDNMKLAAAHAIASAISDDELHERHIIPSVFAPNVTQCVAQRVYQSAVEEGVARRSS